MGKDVNIVINENIRLIYAANDLPLLHALVKASHGAMTLLQITDMLAHKLGEVVMINDRLITGLSWETDSLVFFGFHGDMQQEDLVALDQYSRAKAKEKELSKIQFLSPRQAWMKLLKPLKYRATMFVYETEV